MATAWYKNYLAADVQPWARQVQKEIDNLKSNFQSAEVNNTTRDDQLASSLRQVQTASAAATTAANSALAAINGLTGLGEPGSEFPVDGANLTANSVTVNEIDSNYVYAGTLDAGQITAGTISGDFISGGTITGTTISGDAISGGTIDATNISGVNITGVNVSGSSISGTGITGGTIYGTNIEAATFTSGGLVDTAEINCGIIYVSQDLRALVNTSVAGNTQSTFAGNLFINSSGIMFRDPTISSQEAKENVVPYEFDTDAFIAVNPVTFNYKEGVFSNPGESDVTQLGFILEDFEAAGLGEHLVIPANEIDQYKGLRYDKLYMFLHKVVQEQQAKIAELEARITTLEG